MSSTFLSPPHKESVERKRKELKKKRVKEGREKERMDSSPWLVIK